MSETDSYSDQVAADAGTQQMPEPAGAKHLRVALAMKRRDRSDLMAKIEPLAVQLEKVGDLSDEFTGADGEDQEIDLTKMLGSAAASLQLMADVQDVLADMSHDRKQFIDYAEELDDSELMELFSYAINRLSLGKA